MAPPRVVTESALGASGLGPDELGDALTGDPDMIALTQKVLEAAAASGNEQKLRGLGELLGRAAANPGGSSPVAWCVAVSA